MARVVHFIGCNQLTLGSEKMIKESIKIACILDTFSYDCLKYEGNLLYLSKNTWRDQIKKFQPDLLLVESIWEGIDKSWKAELVNNKSKQSTEIEKLINYCKSHNITTVFWNKEDPPNYDRFIDIAVQFDFIFTTDHHCIGKYSEIVGEERVFLLPFAAQPLIHNPIGKSYNGRIAFAGSWYEKKHFLRQSEMEYILDGALEFDNIDIFDRNYKNGLTNYPQKYAKYVNGGLEYNEMVKKYKEYNVFLNVNIVFYSETMFSRRVFEILASGTNVVSSYALGIENYFSELVPISNTEEGIRKWVKRLFNDVHFSKTLSILGIREIYDKHLYEHRMHYLLESIGVITKTKIEKEVLVVVRLNNINNIKVVLDNFKRQSYSSKKLIIIHGVPIDFTTDSNINYKQYVDFQLFIEALEENEYLAIMSESSYYGSEYLTDYIHATKYTSVPILGKSKYYNFSNSCNSVVSGIENNFVDFTQLNFNTIFIRTSAIDKQTILDIYNQNEVRLSERICYSINMYEFANTYVVDNVIHEKIKINKILIEQLNITVEKYKQQLLSKVLSDDYLGFNQILRSEIIQLLDAPIVIYATGEHTEKVLNIIDRNEFNIIGLTDSNETLFGTYKFGLLIESLNYWIEKGMKCIYISSRDYEEEIYLKLKSQPLLNNVSILNLYSLNEKYKEDIFREIYLDEIY